MVRGPARADDTDMLAVRPPHQHRTYHLQARVLAGLAGSTLVLLLASISHL